MTLRSRTAAAQGHGRRQLARWVPPLLVALAIVAAIALLAPVAHAGVDGTTASDPSAHSLGGVDDSVVTPGVDRLDGSPGLERDGDDLVLSVSADRIDGGDSVDLTVAVDGVDADASVTVERSGASYVGSVQIADLVDPDVETSRSNADVTATFDGETVLEATADLRLLAQRGSATFDGATLSIPVDARGLGDTRGTLALAPGSASVPAAIDGEGSNATLRVEPTDLADLDLEASYEATPTVDGARVPGDALAFSIVDAAERATAIEDSDGDVVLVQPLLHPSVGPDRVSVTLATGGPSGYFQRTAVADDGGVLSVPADVLAATDRTVTVADGAGRTLLATSPGTPGTGAVTLRVEDGRVSAPSPDALSPYESVVFRDAAAGVVEHLRIDETLRAGENWTLPASIDDPEAATALLVGPDDAVAVVDLEVVESEDEEATTVPAVSGPDADEFVGIWLDVGAGAGLLVLAMVGAILAVLAGYVVRLVRPAGLSDATGGAVAAHFLLGGVGGVVAIAAVQAVWWNPVIGTVAVGPWDVGLGALLVGVFHGGLTAIGLRVGLGTLGVWPAAAYVDATAVPVRVAVTDDDGRELPGEQRLDVRRPDELRVVETTTVGGTTTEVTLPPGEYEFVARTGQRETDPERLGVPVVERSAPEPLSVHLTVQRPGLSVVVTDSDTGEPIDGATVTVTTDRDETRSASTAEGTASVVLPVATTSVTVVVDAEGYDASTIEQPIDDQLTTVDAALDPTSGTLAVEATVGDDPVPDARVLVAPAAETESSVGRRTAELRTDEAGRASADLPVGTYGVRLALDGPNAARIRAEDRSATVERDATTTVALKARFVWSPPESVQSRAVSLRETIRSIGAKAAGDPTVPVYFASVPLALLDLADDLGSAGQYFATGPRDPNVVAAALVDAASASLGAVGTAMQSPTMRPVLAVPGEPDRVQPTLDATPSALFDYLEEDVGVASIEARASTVADGLDDAVASGSARPLRAVLGAATELREGASRSIQVSTREFAALLLVDAVEQAVEHDPIVDRLERAPTDGEAGGTAGGESD